MSWFSDLLGTMKTTFGIGPKGSRATLSATGLTAPRTLALPDKDGTLATLGDVGGGGPGLTAQTVHLTATQASTATALANVTQLVLPVAANGIYLIDCTVTFRSAATTTGLNLGLTSPAGASNRVEIVVPITSTAAASQLRTIFPNAAVAENAGNVLGTGVTAINSNHTARISGTIVVGATAGNVQIVFATEVANSAVTLQIGSRLTLIKVA